MLNDLPTPTVRFLYFPSYHGSMQMCSLSRQVPDVRIRRWLPRCFASGRSGHSIVRHSQGTCHPLRTVIWSIRTIRRSKEWGPKNKWRFRRKSRDKLWNGNRLSLVGMTFLWAWPYWERSFRWSCRPEKCVHLPVDTGCGISTILLPLCGPTRTVAAKLSHVVCLE